MLTEARDLGEELGDTEIRAEAMAWRVPAFVALGDLESARREVAALLATAEQTAQPFMLHVAEHYGSAIALCDGRLDEAEASAQRSHEWSRLLTGRDAVGRLRDPDVQHPPRAGPAGRARAGDPDPRRRRGPRRPLAARAGLAARRARHGGGGAARARARRRRGLDPFRESLWLASLTYLTDACAALGDEAIAALVYPELEPLAGTNVMIGHLVACYGAADRYLGMLAATLGEGERARGPLRARAGAQPPDGRRDVARPHRLRVRAHAAGARPRRARPGRRAARRGGRARRADRHAGAPRSASGRSAPQRRPRASPTGSPPREVRDPPLVARGSATARSAPRCSSASTPPPTTCAASCARRAARTAPRRRPTRTATASSRPERRARYDRPCRST